MKPSKLFHDDNSSSRYWDSGSIIRWNKECMNRAKSHVSGRLLIKLAVLSILFVGLGYLVTAWLSPRFSPTTHRTAIDQAMIVNFNKNLSITNSSMTEEPSAEITRMASTPQPSTDVMSRDDEHVEKSTDEVLLTKQYVSTSSEFVIFSLCDFFSLELWLHRRSSE